MSLEFDTIQNVFLEASMIAEPAARQAYLDNVCKGNSKLRHQVEALLFSHENAGEFLRRSVVSSPTESLTEGPGTLVGKYRLLQEIGEGGFGVVFMAEQLEPVQRKVALKVIKPGMDTREVIARFEAERQALALMDHPNVARVLDGGTTASGRPYFVMDLVKGAPITDFCDQNELTPKDRLNLFLQVCAGVQHAHQKGIIHRDLKPTNVLVTVQDGLPLVKVIDFGIAKAIGQKLTEKTLFTRFEQLLGTPTYMSPEQTQWSSTDVDTRSDIYSLGVLLYELLTGTTPFEKETLARAALDEVRRTIREVDPPAPSTRLQTLGPRVAQIAQHRHTEPTQLARLVKGELDWIVMRALDKDRGRRYETANSLSQDLQRYLRDEPISAGPPSRIYLAGKFVRRHRAAVGTAVGITVTLMVGLGLALFGLSKARHESARATAEADSAQAISTFFNDEILALARPNLHPWNRDITLRQVIELAAPKIEERFSKQPLIAAKLHLNVGRTFFDLGENAKAEEHLRRAVALRLQNRRQVPIEELFRAQEILAEFLYHANKPEEAQKIQERLVKESGTALGTNHWLTLETERNLADTYSGVGKGYLAEKLYRSILERQTRQSGSQSYDALGTANSLALLCFNQGRFFEAAGQFEGILEIERKKDARLMSEPAITLMKNLGSVYYCLGEYAKGIGVLDRCVASADQVLGPIHPNTTSCRLRLMNAEGNLGHWRECAELGEQMIKANGDDQLDGALYQAALCSLVVSDTNVYGQLCARLNELAGNATNKVQRLAEVLCVALPPLYDSAQAERVVDRALVYGDKEYTRIPKGISEYRRGNFQEALKWLQDRTREHDLLAAQAAYFVAMADWKLGNTNDAKKTINLAQEKLNPALKRGYLWELWHELPRAILAKREAQALIPCAAPAPEPDAATLAMARERWHPLKVHIDKGTELGGQMRWSEARDEFLAAARSPLFELNEIVAYDYEVPGRIAAATLAAKDETAYQECRANWLAWCKATDDIPGDLIEACFLPASGAAPDAELLCHVFPYNPKQFNSYLGSLLLAFRAGHFERVLELRAPTPTEDESISDRYAKRATAQVFRAMALAKTGQLEEGSRLLQELDKKMAPYFEHYEGDLWWDIVFCKIALDEAHSMFTQMASAK